MSEENNSVVALLRTQIAELQKRLQEAEDKEYGLFVDDVFEYLLIVCKGAMNEKLADMFKFTFEFYKKYPDRNPTMKKILELFPGNTSLEKRTGLKNFLKENPGFRTTNPELLLQRLTLLNQYGEAFQQEFVPSNPIKDAINRLYCREQPEQQEEPQDEDFLK